MKTFVETQFAKAIFFTTIFAIFSFEVIGTEAFTHSRTKRYLGWGTNPNNIRVSLGNQRPLPVNSGESGESGESVESGESGESAGNGGWGNRIPTQQKFQTQNYQQPNNYGGQYNSFGGGNYQQSVDTNNYGGTHQNNVGVGGIQNFAGARGEARDSIKSTSTEEYSKHTIGYPSGCGEAERTPIFWMWNSISEQQEAVHIKYLCYGDLSMLFFVRLWLHKYYIYYIKRVKPIEEKSAAIALALNNFNLKFKQAQQKMTDFELAKSSHLNKMIDLDFKHATVQTLKAQFVTLTETVPRAAEMKEVFVALHQEWIDLRQKIDIDLDDCISRIDFLKQEINRKYGDMNE
ncbi:unnamed protein product [Orchesella dallaii]|uniref:Uncharacterized protein n=1 Tax=Orchesella dallaii TaxID=48710 RepID=A0ABP1QLY5_9HEXA